MKRNQPLCWYEVFWSRPYSLENIHALLTHLACSTPRGLIVWEIRGKKDHVRFFLGTFPCYSRKIHAIFRANCKKIRFNAIEENERTPMTMVKRLKITKPTLSLSTDVPISAIRAGLAAMSGLPKNVEATMQIIFGPSYAPRSAPKKATDPHATWFDYITGNVTEASSESLKSICEKSGQHGFFATLRLGLNEGANTGVFYNIISALRILETAGVRISAIKEKTENLNKAHAPWHFPLKLSTKEVANFLLLPAGDSKDFKGVDGVHPRVLLPPSWYRYADDNSHFAISPTGAKLGISPQDSLEHTVVLGPTGAGKSVVLINRAIASMNAGHGVLLIDPKADLVNDVLARAPDHRVKDIIVLDPSDPCPVGFNPFAFKDYGNPNLIADAILAVFKEVFSENWGIRSQDVFTAGLLTLAHTPKASLLWLPTLLVNQEFRQRITSDLKDKIGLEPYWSGFEALRDGQRQAEIAPILNKMRQFMLRPGLRNVLGQSNPKFNLTDLFTKNKIVLVPLNKGIIGSESAKLLGSLIVGMTWTLVLSRASLPKEQRSIISIFVDELQDYLALPTDISDAFAQARALGVSLNVAHQYRAQLPAEMRSGIDANARNKIIFGLNGEDAKAMAAQTTDLESVDFMQLPRYHIYTSLQSDGRATDWMSGTTLPPPPKIREPIDIRAESMKIYGQPVEEVEKEYLEILNVYHNFSPGSNTNLEKENIGRKKIS